MPLKEPNYTQIPNEILDRMNEYTPAEFKVLMAICRRTFGWHKRSDVISLSQLEEMTGLSRSAVQAGIMAGIERKILERVQTGKQTYSYQLVVSDYQSTQTTSSRNEPEPGVSGYQSANATSSLSGTELVASGYSELVVSDYTQKKQLTELKKLKENDGDARTREGPPPPFFEKKDTGGGDAGDTDDGYDPFESLLEIDFAAVQATQAIAAYEAASIPLDVAEVARIAAYVCENPAGKNNPAAFLASQWRHGKVPPLARPVSRRGPAWDNDTNRFEPQPATVPDELLQAARRMREESDRRAEVAGPVVGLAGLGAVLAGPVLRPIAPAAPRQEQPRPPLAFPAHARGGAS